MQSTTIYGCVGGLCGAPLHGSWVLVVLKRALYIAFSGARRQGRHFAGGAAAPAAPPLDPRLAHVQQHPSRDI